MVRVLGEHLVMLRRGRLFTVRIGGGALESVVSAAMLDPGAARFHSMFVSDSGAQVTALDTDYKAGETQVALFRLGEDGRLADRGGWRLRATPDIWRTDHVAQLEDGRIVFFDQREISLPDSGFAATLPAVRPAGASWRITAPATRVYRSVFPLSYGDDPTLHTVTVCDPVAEGAGCRSTAVYAPRGRISHVSRNAAYLWIEHYGAVPEEAEDDDEEDDGDDGDREVLYRIPFDGSPATALMVTGSPRDADSFLESGDGYLNVLVLHDGWTEESRSRSPVPALLRLPLADLGDGRRTAARERYRLLPDFAGLHYNRFVGDWVTYGNRPFGEYLTSSGLFTEARAGELGVGALRWAGQDQPAWMPLRRGVEAIEPIGSTAALVVGNDGRSLELALLRLGDDPRVAGRIPRGGIGSYEGRMYGVVAHQPDGADSGLIGLTLGAYPEPFHFRATSAAFFRYDAGGLRQLGELALEGEPTGSREVVPIFAQGRIFAVLDEELVEVAEENGSLREVRRISLP